MALDILAFGNQWTPCAIKTSLKICGVVVMPLESLEINMVRPDSNFWTRKRVPVTGHTGFKGGWLTIWLQRLGAQVSGISLKPNTDPNLFEIAKIDLICDSHFCDIRNKDALSRLIKNLQPEVVFHLAAQPLVRASYEKPAETFNSNIMGTVNLLDALRNLKIYKSCRDGHN